MEDNSRKPERMIAFRQGLGAAGEIYQNCQQPLRHVVIDNPCMIVVKHGIKHFDNASGRLVMNQGDAVAVWRDTWYDVTNFNGADGYYSAEWVSFDRDMVKDFAAKAKNRRTMEAVNIKKISGGLKLAFDEMFSLLKDQADIPAEIARHRMEELLIWLDMGGYFACVRDDVNLPWNLRQTISGDPANRWDCGSLAKSVGMSESTLRRRLAEYNTTIADVVTDVRMSYALNMIQSTDFSITRISAECGYESPSRFAVRFKERFGFSPSSVRRGNPA
ncbi:MAG: helix-turn-helix transcriptional regulator [Deferribacterales bacterium]